MTVFAKDGLAVPNIVTDIYKVRSGQWTQVRIWSSVDLGNLRKQDLYITDSRLVVLSEFQYQLPEIDWENTNWNEQLQKVNDMK